MSTAKPWLQRAPRFAKKQRGKTRGVEQRRRERICLSLRHATGQPRLLERSGDHVSSHAPSRPRRWRVAPRNWRVRWRHSAAEGPVAGTVLPVGPCEAHPGSLPRSSGDAGDVRDAPPPPSREAMWLPGQNVLNETSRQVATGGLTPGWSTQQND